MKSENKLAYCVTCDALVKYEIRRRMSKCQIRGISIECEERAAFCLNCHGPVWLDEIDAYNIRSARTAYCDKVDLITPDEIEALEHQYGIGIKPLSQLLGWDESILRRYLEGDTIPSRDRSDILKDLLKNEETFYKLVDANKDWMNSEAYDLLTKNRKAATPERTFDSVNPILAGTYTYMGRESYGKPKRINISSVAGFSYNTDAREGIIILPTSPINDNDALEEISLCDEYSVSVTISDSLGEIFYLMKVA
ncbi:MAG: hypothetical protein LUD72_01635 [Bacteroidales bacterium]|nr:hypothetical protein [Bacteroidales bacterium]